MTTTAVSPLAAPASAVTTFTLTGTSTAWVSGTTTFAVAGITGASITSQSVASATSATVVVSLPATPTGTLTFSNSTDSSTATATVYSWQQLKDDQFQRANTTVGAAGTQSAVNGNWIDVAGNTWKISNNVLSGVGTGTQGSTLLRVTSENQAASRIVVNKNADSSNQGWGLVLRGQSDTSRYFLYLGGATFRITRVSSANAMTTLLNNVLTDPARTTQGGLYATGDNITVDFSVVDVAGSPVLTAIWTNNTTGYTFTCQYQDTYAAKITAAGQAGIDVYTASPVFTCARATTYYNNAVSAAGNPTGSLSGVSNLAVALTGTGTAWTSGTTFTLATSGSNGATIGSTAFTSATRMTVTLGSTGTANDSLVLKDNTSGTLVAVAVVASTIAVAPGLVGSARTGAVVTVTGNNQKWTTNAPSFSVSGVTGVSITAVTVVSDTAAQLTLTTGSAVGTVTLTESTYPAANTFAVIFTLPLTNSNIVRSPYVWHDNGTLWSESNYAGAYLRVNFTTTTAGPLAIIYDPSINTANGLPANDFPVVAWSLNPTLAGGTYTKAQTSPSTGGVLTLVSSLAAGTYTLLIYIVSITGSTVDTARWNPSARKLRILGLQADPSIVTNAIASRPNTALFLGDSITQGAGVLAKTSPTGDDAFGGWSRACADALDCEWGNVGIAGQTFGTISGTATSISTPPLYNSTNTPPDTFSYFESGISRLVSGLFSPQPSYCIINMGTNDSAVFTSQVAPALTALRALCGYACKIVIVVPFDQNGLSSLTAGLTAYLAATGDRKVYLVNCGNDIAPVAGVNNSTSYNANAYTYDGLHPAATTATAFGAAVARLIRDAVSVSAARSHFLKGRQPNRRALN